MSNNMIDGMVVDLDDVRMMELLGECAKLRKEVDAERDARKKIKDEERALLQEKKKLMATLKAEQRRSRDLQNSLAIKNGELNEVRGMKIHLQRLSQLEGMDLSFNIQQEKNDFEQKKAANAKSKTELLWQLENLWQKYESMRESYESMDLRAKAAYAKVRTFALQEEKQKEEQDALNEKSQKLQAKVDSLEESMRIIKEKQDATKAEWLRQIQTSRRDLRRRTIDLQKHKEEAKSLRKSTKDMASQIMDFQDRKAMYEITIRKYVVEGAMGNTTLKIIKNPSTREIKLQIEASGEDLGLASNEILIPFCEINVKILGDNRFQVLSEKNGNFSFSSPNAHTIVDDFLEIKHIDLTRDRFSAPPSPTLKPSRRKIMKTKVS